MFIDGMISEVGVGDKRDGVLIDLDEPRREGGRAITITGLSRDELRAAARMLYERVTIRIDSRDERARLNDEQPAQTPGNSNIDEATGIKKTGEI